MLTFSTCFGVFYSFFSKIFILFFLLVCTFSECYLRLCASFVSAHNLFFFTCVSSCNRIAVLCCVLCWLLWKLYRMYIAVCCLAPELCRRAGNAAAMQLLSSPCHVKKRYICLKTFKIILCLNTEVLLHLSIFTPGFLVRTVLLQISVF